MPLTKHILFFIALTLFCSEKSTAQIQSVLIGVNGLTCSQCSRNVEMSIRKLDFVKEVRMNLQNTEGEIFFTEGGNVDITKIAKSVVDAGFSVRYIKAKIYFAHLTISENYCWAYQNSSYQFVKTSPKELNSITTVTFIGKQFMPKTEYKKWFSPLKEAQGKGCEAKQVYFICVE